MKTLVIAEHDNASLKADAERGGSWQVRWAATWIFWWPELVAARSQMPPPSPASGKVICADNAAYEHQLAENVSLLVADLGADYDNLLAPSTANGKNIMPRVAALLDVGQISDILAVESADTFKRPIYAGNVIATVQSADAKKVITVRTTAFDAVAAEGGNATVEACSAAHDAGVSSNLWREEVAESDRPELTSASVVISGGRGMQNGDNFSLLEGIADKLNAAIGASRAAVDAGFVPNDYPGGADRQNRRS